MRQAVVIFTLCCISFYLNAQKLEYFSNHDHINELLFEEDRIWVATNGGLLELDIKGELIKKHTVLDGINSPKVEHVLRDEEGSLFIETNAYHDEIQIYKEGRWLPYKGFKDNKYISLIRNNGLFGYVNNSDAVIHLKSNGKWKEYKTGLEGFGLKAIAVLDDEDNLWVSYRGGVIKHNGDSCKMYSFYDNSRQPWTLLKDKNGDLWASSILDSWYRYNKKKDAWTLCESEICTSISNSRFSFSDSKQNLWFTNSKGNLLHKYNGSKWEDIVIPFRDLPKDLKLAGSMDWLHCGTEDKAGNLWFGTAHGNLYKYNGKDWSFINLSQKSTYFKDGEMAVSSIIKDENENMWIAGRGYLAYCNLEKKENLIFSKEKLKQDSKSSFSYSILATKSLVEDGLGNIYTNPQKGVFKYEKKTQKWKYFWGRYSIDFMYYNKKDKASYFLNNKGLLIRETDEGEITFKQVAEDKEGNGYLYYQAVHVDSKGDFWVAVNKALRYSTKDSTQVFDASNSPIKDSPGYIYEDSQGRIWVNIKDGIAYWDGKTWLSFTKQNSPITDARPYYRNKNELPITEDKDGNIFLRSKQSIFKWDGRRWMSHRSWNDCLKDGSFSSNLFIDSKNNLWTIDRQGGISKCEGTNCQSIIKKFEVDYIDIIEDAKNRIWILTDRGGIFRYNP
jgi:ligand-binding sensor domain-containing protein